MPKETRPSASVPMASFPEIAGAAIAVFIVIPVVAVVYGPMAVSWLASWF